MYIPTYILTVDLLFQPHHYIMGYHISQNEAGYGNKFD